VAYNPTQKQIIALALRESAGAPRKARRALLEALSVESSFRPLPYGDRDSVGVLQQRPSQGWGPASESAATDIHQFLSRAVPLAGRYATAGQLAQAVQRSAFPARYDQRKAEAVRLLAGGPPAVASRGVPVLPPAGVAGGGRVARGQAAAGNALLGQLAGLVGLPPSLVPTTSAPPVSQRPSQVSRLQVKYTGGATATPRVRNVIALAHQYLGTPYVWGGSKPGGFDCSGFVQWLYGKEGVQLPRTSQEQWRVGTPISKSQLKAGDLVFFEPTPTGPGHVALYQGGGKIVESPHTGATVRVSTLRGRKDYMGARRIQ
jgi:cell wall-associated NlpC family hydrolase